MCYMSLQQLLNFATVAQDGHKPQVNKRTGYVPETGFSLSRPWKVKGIQGNKKKKKKKQ